MKTAAAVPALLLGATLSASAQNPPPAHQLMPVRDQAAAAAPKRPE